MLDLAICTEDDVVEAFKAGLDHFLRRNRSAVCNAEQGREMLK